jgi:arylformamidase
MIKYYDISRPISPKTAVWLGDTTFSSRAVMAIRDGDSVNVAAITLSTHTGTHADAPRHYVDDATGADALDISKYVGRARVITLDTQDAITRDVVARLNLEGITRILIHTPASELPDDVFPSRFAHFTSDAADLLGQLGIILVGTDAPSVDEFSSKTLLAHKMLLKYGIAILEGLALKDVPDGDYDLIAMPLKIIDADAAPARAILIASAPDRD